MHAAAVRGLERIGVKVGTAQGRKTLKRAGADVDDRTQIVKFPSALVEEILRKPKAHVILYGRDPVQDADLDLHHVHLCNDGTAGDASGAVRLAQRLTGGAR